MSYLLAWLGRQCFFRLATRLLGVLVLVGAGLAPLDASATTTATVSAFTGQTCAATRHGSDLNCTANDFAVQVEFTQPSANLLSSCIAGTTVTIDVIASLQSGSPDRYDVAIWTGEVGNDPGVSNAANSCSIGVFPNSPDPFHDNNTNFCGDYYGTGNSNSSPKGAALLTVTGVSVLCSPAPGNTQLALPYLVGWANNSGDTRCDNASDYYSLVKPFNSSKCVKSAAALVTGVIVQGYVKIIKATLPNTSTQTFSFTASTSAAVTLSTTSFSLPNGGSLTVTIPVPSSGTQTYSMTVTEALTAAWDPTANITCVTPAGITATNVTINNANRTIKADISRTNYGVICTITNTRYTRVRTTKSVLPGTDTGSFTVSAQSALGTTSTTTVSGAGTTSYANSTATAFTVTETVSGATSMTKYVTGLVCSYDFGGSGTITYTTSGLSGSGATRTATLSPTQYSDSTCAFTNTRSAGISVSKTNGISTVASGGTTAYTITVVNSGPSDADGSVLKDPVATGLSCTGAACSAAGGAACPGASDAARLTSLQSAGGLALSTLPSTSTLTFTLSCNVTATGS